MKEGPAARANGVVLLLCAMALASMTQRVPGRGELPYWASLSAGVAIALAAVVFPRFERRAFLGVALFLVLVPSVLQMGMRTFKGPETFCHDSVLQFEEAVRMVRRGENPYAQDFFGTPLERWDGWKDNPALYHFVYPPFLLLLSVPFEAAGRAVGFYDQRVVLLLFWLGLLGLLLRRLRDHPHGVAVASLVALNPWFGPFVVEGRNDVVVVFLVAAAWLAYEADRRLFGHLLVGLAVAAKTMMLPLVPFFVAAHRREWHLCGLLLLAPFVLAAIPFVAADAPAFFEDVFGAPAGWGAHPFEIRGWGGFGFANAVLLAGLVKSREAYFPFWIFQAAALVPCLGLGLRGVRAEPSFGTALLWSALTILALLFFGRFIHDNYIGAILSLAVISHTARETPPAAGSIPASG